MPIINIIFFIHDLERGGPELRLLNFAKHFPNNYRIHICVMSEDLSLKNKFEFFHVKVLVVPIRKLYFSLRKILIISKYIKDNRINIINAFELKGLLISIFIKFQNIKYAKIVYHNVIELSGISLKQKSLLLPLLKYTNLVICNSHFLKNQLNDYIDCNRISVIHNGTDLSILNRNEPKAIMLKARLGINDDQIVLGTVANLRKQKNYSFLIHGFNILLSKNKNLKLLCVGGGELNNEIVTLIKQLNLQDHVFLTGYTEKVIEYLNIMDVFVLTSLAEGLPNALIEAMGMGIPAISSSVGGCSDLIENLKNGILFPVNDMVKFVQAVEDLIGDNSLAPKLGARAKKTIENRFSLNRMIDNYLLVYEKLSVEKTS